MSDTQPPIPYNKTFDPLKLLKEKLENVDDQGNKRTDKFPTFSGEFANTAEAFLHCLEYFERHAQDRLGIPPRNLYNRFIDILSGVAYL